jgi:hypothetical protein
MARSSYIYVVYTLGRVGGSSIVGTFTVKHEMITRIRRWVDSGASIVELRVLRFPDGALPGESVYVGTAQEVTGLA